MLNSSESVKEALEIEAESVSGIEAASAEHERGEEALSAGLLLEAIEKERSSLDLLGQGIETMQVAINDRRQALDQQEELCRKLMDSLKAKSSSR